MYVIKYYDELITNIGQNITVITKAISDMQSKVKRGGYKRRDWKKTIGNKYLQKSME